MGFIFNLLLTGDNAMSITKNHNGSITLSDIYKGYYRHQTYYFYTIREAKRLFKEYLTTL